MRKLLLSLVLVFSGCWSTTVQTSAPLGAPSNYTSLTFLWGMIGDTVWAGGTRGAARVDVYTGPLDYFVALLTVGLVYPQSVVVWSSAEPAGPQPVVVVAQQQGHQAAQQGGQQQSGQSGQAAPAAQANELCRCGATMAAGSRFCAACGEPRALPGVRAFCESCGTKIQDGWEWCSACGTKR